MWFSETPWPPMVLFAALGVMLGLVGMSQQKKIFLLSSVLAFVACIAVYFIEQSIVTEGERLEQSISDLAETFEQNQSEQFLDFFSPSDPKLKLVAAAAMEAVDISDHRVTDFQYELISAETQALTTFRVNANVNVVLRGEMGHQPSRWKLKWQLEAGEWKITEVSRLKLIGPVTDEIPIYSSQQ